MRYYRMFDRCLATELEFSLPECTGSRGVDVTIRAGFGSDHAAGRFVPYHEWRDGGGDLAFSGARNGNRYLLRFPDLADFLLDPHARTIAVDARTTCSENTLHHLLLDQVLPRYLGHNGSLVLHAGCVEIAAGRGIAFVGPSGSGKSTLTGSFWRDGFRPVSDDCMLVEDDGRDHHIVPGSANLRLWPDAVTRLIDEPQELANVTQYSDKKIVELPEVGDVNPHAVPTLAALFLLGDASGAHVRLEPVRGGEATMGLVESSFALDMGCSNRVRRNLELAARLVESGIPMFRLSYPRRFSALARVRQQILEAVDSGQ